MEHGIVIDILLLVFVGWIAIGCHRLAWAKGNAADNAAGRAGLRQGFRHPIVNPPVCLSITFRNEEGKRERFHPHKECPKHNTTKPREQLIQERPGQKYSTNNHVIEA
jgi:hypothetical protein